MRWLMQKLSVRRCKSPVCSADGGWHTHHLTLVGQARYVWWYSLKNFFGRKESWYHTWRR